MLIEDPATEYGSEEEKAAAVAAGEEAATAAGEEGGEPVVEPEPESDAQAQLLAEREQRIRLEERLAAQKAELPPEKKEPPKEFSRQQLRSAVTEGTLDEDQMETMWSDQERAKTVREMDERMDARDRKRDTVNIVQTDTAKYLANHPDIQTVGSPDWNKLKGEYDFLVSLGHKDDKTTELAAMRSAFGPPDRIRESTSSRRQTASETASAQGGAGGGGSRPVDIWNRVPEWLRPGLKEMVAKGNRTLEDVEKDIPFMKSQPS